MVAKNDITGDNIQSKVSSKLYQDNYDNIFRKTPKEIQDAENEDEAFRNIETFNNLQNEQK